MSYAGVKMWDDAEPEKVTLEEFKEWYKHSEDRLINQVPGWAVVYPAPPPL